ncbi:uncharacterized protein LOC131244195 [Magnolia sinica]|uniref:uncharacterized protein LOC131244195 n=1 Tax=Magnolia sinica TaxID=86752 RepID=UPI002657C7AB|nr:uncharacterized protein LOC131244195 [Magnolia sinica]
MIIANHKVYRILVDTRSSADILYSKAFNKMGIDRSCLRPVRTSLHGFAGDKVISERAISLPVTTGEGQNQVTLLVDFLVLNTSLAYNVTLGRPSLNAMRVVVSTYHLMMKFPAIGMIDYLRGDRREARCCYVVEVRKGLTKQALAGDMLDPREDPLERNSSMDDLLTITLDDTDPSNRKGAFEPERYAAIVDKVTKLINGGFIEEVLYLDWIANVMLVKKANEKWRVWVDYLDMNKACLIDSFPLPRIDQLVDSIIGHELLTFMDAYSGYNQVAMHPPDKQKMTFVTDKGLYSYRVMLFDLKNAGVTYQRLVNKMFAQQIG